MHEKHHRTQDKQQAAYEAPEFLDIVLRPLFLRGRVVILWSQKWSHLLHSNEMSFLHGGKRSDSRHDGNRNHRPEHCRQRQEQ